MAGVNPELQAQLRALDAELEDGDITRKGYEKRRTLILSQFYPAQQFAQRQSSLQTVPQEPAGYAQTSHVSPRASMGGDGRLPSFGANAAYNVPGETSPIPENLAPGGVAGLRLQPPTPQYETGPPSQVQRFQEQQLGMRPASSYSLAAPSSAASHASTVSAVCAADSPASNRREKCSATLSSSAGPASSFRSSSIARSTCRNRART